MPGALTTLLANNAMHLVPGGKRRRTVKKTRKGGSTKPLDELNDLLNHYGCTPYEGYESTNACLASIRDKLDDPNTSDSVRRRITDDYNRIVNLVDQVERIGGRRHRGGAAGRTREQIVTDIEQILTKYGCGNYTPESARTCQGTIDAKLDDPNLQPGAPYRAVLNDFTRLNNYLVELRNVGGRKTRLPKKTRRATA